MEKRLKKLKRVKDYYGVTDNLKKFEKIIETRQNIDYQVFEYRMTNWALKKDQQVDPRIHKTELIQKISK